MRVALNTTSNSFPFTALKIVKCNNFPDDLTLESYLFDRITSSLLNMNGSFPQYSLIFSTACLPHKKQYHWNKGLACNETDKRTQQSNGPENMHTLSKKSLKWLVSYLTEVSDLDLAPKSNSAQIELKAQHWKGEPTYNLKATFSTKESMLRWLCFRESVGKVPAWDNGLDLIFWTYLERNSKSCSTLMWILIKLDQFMCHVKHVRKVE